MSILASLVSAAALAAATLGALSAPAMAEPITPEQIAGEWRSDKPENLGQMFGTRAFTFSATDWSLVFKAYGDAAASQPLFTLTVGGPYVLGGQSAAVSGATEATFLYTTRKVTADSEAGAALFAGMGCTLAIGAETDISKTGCGFLPSILASGVEYDLVSLTDDGLRLGDRSGDLSKARPEKLGADGLIRQ